MGPTLGREMPVSVKAPAPQQPVAQSQGKFTISLNLGGASKVAVPPSNTRAAEPDQGDVEMADAPPQVVQIPQPVQPNLGKIVIKQDPVSNPNAIHIPAP